MKPIGVPTATTPSPIVTPPGGTTVDDEPPEMTSETMDRKRAEDSALSRAIDAALDKDEEPPR